MKRQYRLRRSSDFHRVRQVGKSYASSLMVLAFLQNELAYSRFGFVVSKRLGNAVQRNRIKRRLREAIRLRLPQIKSGFDVVIIARKPVGNVTLKTIDQSLARLLETSQLLG
ncbi:MAG: ribonuclease P protein component [Anaerolineaceae bacterium]|nr:ribonuclease P protein component [Anaerolineaceae bacterium]